jgi:hypothetical protein
MVCYKLYSNIGFNFFMVVSNRGVGGGGSGSIPYAIAIDNSNIDAGSTMDVHVQMVNTATNAHHHNFSSSSYGGGADHHIVHSISDNSYTTPCHSYGGGCDAVSTTYDHGASAPAFSSDF